MPRPDSDTPGIGSEQPFYHYARNDWRDDRNLLEEIALLIDDLHGPYDRSEPGPQRFRECVTRLRKNGYDKHPDSLILAAWVRETLEQFIREEGGYNLKSRALPLPPDLDDELHRRRKVQELKDAAQNAANEEDPDDAPDPIALLPDPKLRAFARERADAFHNGDSAAYLASLLEKEIATSLGTSSDVLGLILSCERHLARHNLEVIHNYSVSETDLFARELSLGIEVCGEWNPRDEFRLIRTLADTNYHLCAKHLAVVTTDNMPDHHFDAIRSIETRGAIPNLTTLRIREFGPYLDKLPRD